MDILIKGMKLPKKGQYLHILIDENGDMSYERACYDSPRIGFKLHKYKAVALPEHGDLKDANAMLRWLNAKADNRVPVTLGEIINFIEKQQIVLEASE